MSTGNLNGVKVGDNLVMATGNRYRGDEPVTVSRVGRKYLYVTLHGHERRERFDRATGVEEGTHGIRARLYTQDQYDEMNQRQSLFQKLLAAGINVNHEVRSETPTSKLRALLAVMQSDES